MTELLEQAFAEAAKLPPAEQDALAMWVLAELRAEERWDRAFAASADTLAQLADEALAEHRACPAGLPDRDEAERCHPPRSAGSSAALRSIASTGRSLGQEQMTSLTPTSR